MARKKKHPAHENHERWLVSYADFITLLFAFFVVMFASSQTDKAKAKAVSDSVRDAIEKGGIPAAVREVLGGTVDEKGKGNAMLKGPGGAQKGAHEPSEEPRDVPPNIAELVPSLDVLNKELEKEIQAGKLELHLEARGLVVSLQQAAFFPSGEDAIDPSTYASIETIAKVIRTIPNSVRLEGYTDSVPIHTARFRSNWELSAARGIAMLEILSGRFKIPREKLAIAGYADTVPIASNETEEGRARNRRVDIVILSKQSTIMQPQPAAEAAKPGAAEHTAPKGDKAKEEKAAKK